MSLLNIIIMAASFQGLVIALFLFDGARKKFSGNYFLGFLVLLYSVDLFLENILTTDLISTYPHIIGIIDPLLFLYGPLLFMYVVFVRGQNRKRLFLHFMPSIVLFVFYIFLFFPEPAQAKLVTEGFGDSYNQWVYVRELVLILSCIHEFTYILLTIKHINRHQSEIKSRFSSIEDIGLDWFRQLISMTGFLVLLSLFLILCDYFEWLYFYEGVQVILFFCTVLIYFTGYKALKQPGLFTRVEPFENDQIVKYAKSGFHERLTSQLSQRLKLVMEKEKLYLNPNLRLTELSQQLSVSMNHLSQALNEGLGMSFYDFVNAYRVNEAKKLLLNPQKKHLTILAIAEESGFNSKSSFNNTFKKTTHLTPTQYRKLEGSSVD